MELVSVGSVKAFEEVVAKRLTRSPQRTGWKCPVCGKGNDRLQLFNSQAHGDRTFDGPWRVRFYCRHGKDHADGRVAYSAAELFEKYLDVQLLLDGISWDEIADGLNPQLLSGGVGGSRSHTIEDMERKDRYTKRQVLAMRAGAVQAWQGCSRTAALSLPTINHFNLGVTDYHGVQRLAIPIPLDDTWWAVKKYIMDPATDPKPDRKYDMPSGMPVVLMLERARSDFVLADQTVINVAEGEKTMFALHQMNLVPICTTVAGGSTWLQEWTHFFLTQGVTRFRVFTDDDAAGDQYAERIRDSVMREKALALGKYDHVVFEFTRWPDYGKEEDRSKRDGYDVLAEMGEAEGRKFLESLLVEDTAQVSTGVLISRADRHIPDMREVPQELKDLWFGSAKHDVVADMAAIRADSGDFSISENLYHFYAKYHTDYMTINTFEVEAPDGSIVEQRVKRGALKLDKFDPGVGKTYAGVQLAERVALEQMVRWEAKDKDRLEELENLQRAYDEGDFDEDPVEAEKVQRRIARLSKPASKLSVVYAGLRRDTWGDLEQMMQHPHLWYNWQPRNETTCELFEMQQKLASRGYSIMSRLCKGDPDKGGCEASEHCHSTCGRYMHQLTQRVHEYPIVFVRLQNLHLQSLLDRAALVIVDEDPSAVWVQTHEVRLSDFPDDDDLLDVLTPFAREQQQYILGLNWAFKQALSDLEDEKRQNGYDVLRAVDTALARWPYGVLTVLDVINNLDTEVVERLETRTPLELRSASTVDSAPSYHFNTLLRLFLEEAGNYYRQVMTNQVDETGLVLVDNEWNSRINVKDGKYVLLPMDPFDIPPEIPVIALDATGSATEYELAFQRDVFETRYLVRKPDTKTIMLTGSEFIKTATTHDISRLQKLALLQAEQAEREPLVVETKPQSALGMSMLDMLDKFATTQREEAEQAGEPVQRSKVLSSILDKIEHIILRLLEDHPGEDMFLVTYMSLEKYLDTYFKETHPEAYARLHLGHFYGLKGTNRFSHLKLGLVIGTPRIDSDDMDMILSAMFYGQRRIHTPPANWDEDMVWQAYDLIPVPYHNSQEGYWLRTAMDQRLQPVIDKYVAGEMWQAATRIRPHTSAESKTLYSLSGYPALLWVTSTLPYRELLRDAKVDNLVAHYAARAARGERMCKSRGRVVSARFIQDEQGCRAELAAEIAKRVNDQF